MLLIGRSGFLLGLGVSGRFGPGGFKYGPMIPHIMQVIVAGGIPAFLGGVNLGGNGS